jgi:hypothetical protein
MRGIWISIAAMMMMASASALAHPPPPPPEPPHPGGERYTADVGWWFAAVFVDGYAGLTTTPRASAWLRRGSMRYGIEGELGRVWLTYRDGMPLDADIAGSIARAAVDARWTFANAGGGDFSVDFWLEGGAGAHAIQWDGGGRLTRTEGHVSIGLTERFGRRQRYGMDVGVGFAIGRGGSGGAPTCAGPCDEPTPPVHGDGLLVEHASFMADW